MIKKTRNTPHSASEQIYPTCQVNSNRMINKLSMQAITTRTNQTKKIVHRLQTQPQHKIESAVPFQDQWDQTFNRRENYLNSMFNRRKTVLQTISKKNRDIYIKITNQQSHYPISKMLKQQQNDAKPKKSIESLTANSRLMLTLSKNALKQQESRVSTITDKQNISITNEMKANYKRLVSKQLAPILQNIENSVINTDLEPVQSRYLKDDLFLNVKSGTNIKMRHKSVGRTRINDLYTNF